MAEYKHGALGNVNAAGTKVAEKGKAAMVSHRHCTDSYRRKWRKKRKCANAYQ